MEVPVGAVVVVVVLAVICALYLRGDRKAARQLATEQREVLGRVLGELTSLRSALVARGAVEGAEGPPGVRVPVLPPSVEDPPAPPAPAGAALASPASVEAAPLAVEATVEEPPSTKPSQRQETPAATAPPRSAPRSVCFEDQLQRALVHVERRIMLPPDAEARCLKRLRVLGAELGVSNDTGDQEGSEGR
jgi:hypothetical protein